MKYLFDPAAPIMGQLRFMGLLEHLPIEEAIVYRFFSEGNRLLYVGVTVSPRGRWQTHKNRAAWWPEVRAVSVEHYPHERAALDAEVSAIKAERPPFNRRSAPTSLMRDSCAAHESRMSPADAILPRVGGGGRGGVGVGTISPCIAWPRVIEAELSAADRRDSASCNASRRIR